MASNSKGSWRRRAEEGALIVVSILLAFGIDAWWERLGEARLEREVLEAVAEEVDANRASLRSLMEIHRARLADVNDFLQSSPEALASRAEADVEPLVLALINAPTFNPALEATRVMLESPELGQAGSATRSLVSRSLMLWDDAGENHVLLSEHRADVRVLLAPYAAADARDGLARLVPMVARQGPSVLAALRADEPLVAAVIHKAHTQDIYLGELEVLMSVWDSVGDALRETEGR